ncbi:MAG: hypothetical protein GX557_02245 [Chloroflexi bacterium]|nr:hypothetical protein [Chloroflexota bacterium]
MSNRPERPKSIVPFYMYRGNLAAAATSRFSVRAVVIWASALLLIALVSWLYLLQASQVASYAYEIRTLQLAKERVHRQNTILRGQVAMAGSLERIHRVAGEWEYDLPKASDRARHLTLVYEPVPTPDPELAELVGQAEPEAVETSTLERILAAWSQELQDWLEAAHPEPAEYQP